MKKTSQIFLLFFVFLFFVEQGSACPSLDIGFEQDQSDILLTWKIDDSLYYAQVQLMVTKGGNLLHHILIDGENYLLRDLKPGQYQVSIQYIYPFCEDLYIEEFFIEEPPQIAYASSTTTLFRYGVGLFFGIVLFLSIILILRR